MPSFDFVYEPSKIFASHSMHSKIIDSMKQFAESYAKSTDTFFCIDSDVTRSVIQGLAKNKQILDTFYLYFNLKNTFIQLNIIFPFSLSNLAILTA